MIGLFALAIALGQEPPYTATEMDAVHRDVDAYVRVGRFLQAAERLKKVDRPRVPQEGLEPYLSMEGRVGRGAFLLLETPAGDARDVPALVRIQVKGGGKLLGKVIRDAPTFLMYETLTGIKSRLSKGQVESKTPLTPQEAAQEVADEFRRQCGNRGLVVDHVAGRPPVFRDLGAKKATGAQMFALADFCARNGAGVYLAGLFDQAATRDPRILSTVHAAKGERLVNEFLYSLVVNATPAANSALDVLGARYTDSPQFRQKILGDAEVVAAIKVVLKREPPPLPKEAPPAPPSEPGKPAPLEPPVPAIELPPLVLEPPPAEVDAGAPPPPSVPTAMILPPGTPADVAALVAKGDQAFTAAMVHLTNSDPNFNPDGWGQDNAKALEHFQKANEAYLPAQDRYSGKVPDALLERVREATMRASLCRKRSVRR